MILSSAERLLISMQLRRQHQEEPSVGYDTQAEIIEQGYTILYPDVFGSTGEPELDRSVQDDVFEILDMFRALHPGHSVGPKWNPSGDRYYQKFRGFDGNAGTGHYSFARFLIKRTRRYEESDGELNSHGPTLARYQEMVGRWKAMGRTHNLTDEQIDRIVAG